MATLENLQNMSRDALIAALIAAQEAKAQKITFKVTEPKQKDDGTMTVGGAVSVYGLQRFPITLYASQWERLILAIPDLSAFLAANAPRLTRKD